MRSPKVQISESCRGRTPLPRTPIRLPWSGIRGLARSSNGSHPPSELRSPSGDFEPEFDRSGRIIEEPTGVVARIECGRAPAIPRTVLLSRRPDERPRPEPRGGRANPAFGGFEPSRRPVSRLLLELPREGQRVGLSRTVRFPEGHRREKCYIDTIVESNTNISNTIEFRHCSGSGGIHRLPRGHSQDVRRATVGPVGRIVDRSSGVPSSVSH